MKNTIKALGLAGLLTLTGCKEDRVLETYIFSGEDFQNSVAQLAYADQFPSKIEYKVHAESRWRDYPTCGALKPLPRIELRKYYSGKKSVDLYFEKKN